MLFGEGERCASVLKASGKISVARKVVVLGVIVANKRDADGRENIGAVYALDRRVLKRLGRRVPPFNLVAEVVLLLLAQRVFD